MNPVVKITAEHIELIPLRRSGTSSGSAAKTPEANNKIKDDDYTVAYQDSAEKGMYSFYLDPRVMIVLKTANYNFGSMEE